MTPTEQVLIELALNLEAQADVCLYTAKMLRDLADAADQAQEGQDLQKQERRQ